MKFRKDKRGERGSKLTVRVQGPPWKKGWGLNRKGIWGRITQEKINRTETRNGVRGGQTTRTTTQAAENPGRVGRVWLRKLGPV